MYTIYKRTSTGATQVWNMELDGNRYRSISGQIDGKKIVSAWTTVKGVNIGKSNETTPEEQVQAIALSNYTGKLSSGYVANIEDLDDVTKVPFKPMLAKKYEDYPKFLDVFPKYSQPKLDGIRANVREGSVMSRSDKPLVSVPHIPEALQPIFDTFPGLILDGELYASKLSNDFNKIISLAKKSKPTTEDLAESAREVQYWIYDVPSMTGKSFIERNKFLKMLAYEVENEHSIVIVPTTLVQTQEELDELYSGYMDDGMEGQMVRSVSGEYENKRSKHLLKRKEFQDEEFIVKEIEDGKGKFAGIAARVVFDTVDGKEFRAGIIGSHEYSAELFANKADFIGKEATVVYFNLTPDGIPRFPKVKAMHLTDRI